MIRVGGLDYLKLVLAVGVVLGHSILMQNHVVLWSFLLGQGTLRMLVPIFAIASGFFFYATIVKQKFPRYLRRFILLYLFWTIFYAPIWMRGDPPLSVIVEVVIFGFLHLWYVVGMIVAALMIRGCLELGKNSQRPNLPLILAATACAMGGATLGYLDYFAIWPMPDFAYHNGVFVIFPFMTIGYLTAEFVHARGLNSLPRFKVLAAFALLLIALKLGEAAFDMRMFGATLFTMPEFPPLEYIAVFVIFLTFLRAPLPHAPPILGYLTAAIYFLHIAVIQLGMHFGVHGVWLAFLFGIVGSVVIALGAAPFLASLKRATKRPPELNDGPTATPG